MATKPKNSAPSLVWTSNLREAKQKEDFLRTLRNSTLILSRLEEILAEKIASEQTRSVSSDVYDSPSWANKQAHTNGYIEGVKQVKDLLGFLSPNQS